MKLLIDLGNTRLKAALPGAGGLQLLGEAAHREQGLEAALSQALQGVDLGLVGAALCANVAGEAAGGVVSSWLQARGCGPVAFLRACREAYGVRCAYPDPSHLGADRWAALLGARGLTDEPCLIIDAGSALTVDALAPGGRHLGGWIIPGLAMMVAALSERTGELAKLRQASKRAVPGGFPTDTGPAMDDGARIAATGAVLLARRRLEAHCAAPVRLFLAGGDARDLQEAWPEAEYVPDLVLRGLARAAG